MVRGGEGKGVRSSVAIMLIGIPVSVKKKMRWKVFISRVTAVGKSQALESQPPICISCKILTMVKFH